MCHNTITMKVFNPKCFTDEVFRGTSQIESVYLKE